MRFVPFLEYNQVPERPGRVGLRLAMAAHQVLDDVGLENALVADALLAQIAVDQELRSVRSQRLIGISNPDFGSRV